MASSLNCTNCTNCSNCAFWELGIGNWEMEGVRSTYGLAGILHSQENHVELLFLRHVVVQAAQQRVRHFTPRVKKKCEKKKKKN